MAVVGPDRYEDDDGGEQGGWVWSAATTTSRRGVRGRVSTLCKTLVGRHVEGRRKGERSSPHRTEGGRFEQAVPRMGLCGAPGLAARETTRSGPGGGGKETQEQAYSLWTHTDALAARERRGKSVWRWRAS